MSDANDDGEGQDENKAGRTGWILVAFFVVLLVINAAFFAVALMNPPDMVPTGSGDGVGDTSTGDSGRGSHQ